MIITPKVNLGIWLINPMIAMQAVDEYLPKAFIPMVNHFILRLLIPL